MKCVSKICFGKIFKKKYIFNSNIFYRKNTKNNVLLKENTTYNCKKI